MSKSPPSENVTHAQVSDTGQVTIPARIREVAGIKPGSHVVFTPLPDGRVVMRAKSGTLADLKGIVKTKRRATDAQIRAGQAGTVVRGARAKSGIVQRPTDSAQAVTASKPARKKATGTT